MASLPAMRSTVTIRSDSEAVIEHHVVTDPLVVRYLASTNAAPDLLDHVLRLGATVLDSTGNLTMVDALDARLRGLVDQLRTSEQRLDDRTTAAVESLTAQVRDQVSGLGRVLSLDSPDLPLARVVTDISSALDLRVSELHRQLTADQFAPLPSIQRQVEALQAEIAALRERLAEHGGKMSERSVSPAKGFDFEGSVTAVIAEQARLLGDVVGLTGTETGNVAHSKKGDVRVLVNRGDTGGLEVKLAIEVKLRRLGMKPLRDELEAVRLNRGAAAAIAVFGRSEDAPKGVPPFSEVGHRLFACVLEDGDVAPLQYMYRVARLLSIYDLRTDSAGTSLPDIGAGLNEIRQRMAAIAQLKRTATEVKRGIETGVASIHQGLDDHRDAVLGILDQIEAQLSSSEPKAA